MCNLYSHTSNIEAIRRLVGDFSRIHDNIGNLEPQPGIRLKPGGKQPTDLEGPRDLDFDAHIGTSLLTRCRLLHPEQKENKLKLGASG